MWQYVGQGFRLHDVAQKIKVSMDEQLFSNLFADVVEERGLERFGDQSKLARAIWGNNLHLLCGEICEMVQEGTENGQLK